MSQQHSLYCLVVAICVVNFGCATFDPKFQPKDLSQKRQTTVSTSGHDMTLSVEEFIDPKKSEQAFDADLASRGVLALLIRIENRGKTSRKLLQSQIQASMVGTPLLRLKAKEAAEQGAASSHGANALAWTLATGPFALILAPITLVGSSAHTESVNRKVEQHFGSIELPDILLRPDESAAGFVFFGLPFDATKLESISLDIIANEDSDGRSLPFKLELPTYEITLHPSRISSAQKAARESE